MYGKPNFVSFLTVPESSFSVPRTPPPASSSLFSVLQDPPSFLLPGQLIEEELSKLVQTLPPPADEEASLTSLTTTGSLVEPATGEPDEGRDSTDARFDDEFGAGGFQQFDFQRARRDDR